MIAFPELPASVTRSQVLAALEALGIPPEHVKAVSMDARNGVSVYLRVKNIEASVEIPIRRDPIRREEATDASA